MPDKVSLGFQIDTTEIKTTITALDALTEAADRAAKALEKLADAKHGGITISVVGSVASIKVEPYHPHTPSGVIETVINPERAI